VGFEGGQGANGEADPLGGGLPSHDRALALVWGDTMLRRGSLSLPPTERPTEAPLYTVRGGRENTRRCWLEKGDRLTALRHRMAARRLSQRTHYLHRHGRSPQNARRTWAGGGHVIVTLTIYVSKQLENFALAAQNAATATHWEF